MAVLYRLLPLIAWAFAVISLAACLGPIMHESDQASLLAGAHALAVLGESPIGADYYNYDKQYLSYWIVALATKSFPDVDLVLVGNLVCFLIFWISLGLLLVAKPVSSPAQSTALCTLIFTPLLWQHSAYLASNFLAGGFLFLGVLLWSAGSRVRQLVALVSFGASVACRIDVLLILPLTAWCLLPRQTLSEWLSNRRLWLIASVGSASLALGILIADNQARVFYQPFFYPKVFAAYTVFGLGATLLILGIWCLTCVSSALRRSRPWHRYHLLLGATAVVPPFAFYSMQMFSTRHWTVLMLGLFVICVCRRSAPLLRTAPWLQISAASSVLAFISLFVGLRLPFPTKPFPVVAAGTEFPTLDGVLTMGGYWHRLNDMKQKQFLHDHNQAVWLAAKSINYDAIQSPVRVHPTPMRSYLQLSAQLYGQRVDLLPVGTAHLPPFVMDSRSFFRSYMLLGSGQTSEALPLHGLRLVPVSSTYGEINILLAVSGLTPQWAMEQSARMALFNGNEFQETGHHELAALEGHNLVIAQGSQESAKVVQIKRGDSLPQLPHQQDLLVYIPAIKTNQIEQLRQGLHPGIKLYRSRFPAYMDVHRLKAE